MDNQGRLENLLVSQDFSTFSILEHKRNDLPVGAVSVVPTGTDIDEYNQWIAATGGIGEALIDDADDAADAREFNALRDSGAYSSTE